jgi:hypothetical protein
MINPDDLDVLRLDIEQRNTARRRDDPGLAVNEARLRECAMRPLLALPDAISVVQGYVPPLGGAMTGRMCLDDYAAAVARLKADVERGVIPVPCTPTELVTWADGIAVELPPAFTEVLRVDPSHGTIVDTAIAAVDPASEEESASVGPEVISTPRGGVGGGAVDARKRFDFDSEIQALAERAAADFRAKNGRYPSKAELSAKLAKGGNLCAASVERRIRNTWSQTKRGRRGVSAAGRY